MDIIKGNLRFGLFCCFLSALLTFDKCQNQEDKKDGSRAIKMLSEPHGLHRPPLDSVNVPKYKFETRSPLLKEHGAVKRIK